MPDILPQVDFPASRGLKSTTGSENLLPRNLLPRIRLLTVYLSSLFVAYDRSFIVHRRSPLGPVDPSFRALSGRPKFMVRRHTFNKDPLLD